MNMGMILLMAALIWASAIPSFARTPFQIETGYNTAACSNSDRQSYCPISGFPVGVGPWEGGWCDNRLTTDGHPVVPRVWHPGVGDYRSGYPGNISKGRGKPPWPDATHPGDVHNLLYPGNTTKIFALTQYFYSAEEPITQVVLCDPVPEKGKPCLGIPQSFSFSGKYKMSGYSANTVEYSNAAALDLWERGFDGVIANVGRVPYTCPPANALLSAGTYHGQTDIFTEPCSGDHWIDGGLHKLQAAMLAYPADQYQFVIQIDENAFQSPENCHCNKDDCTFEKGPEGASDYYQAQCIRDQLKAILRNYSKGDPRGLTPYFHAGNYLTPASRSPVVQFFVLQGYDKGKDGGYKGYLWQCTEKKPCIVDRDADIKCTSQKECWQKVWSGLRAYARDELGLTPYFILITMDGPSCMYDKNTGRFDTAEADGCFLWPKTTHFPAALKEQLDWNRTTFVDPLYKNWSTYNGVKGANGHPALFFGGAWKGHNDRFTDNGRAATASGRSGFEEGANPGEQRESGLVSQRSGQTWVEMFAEAGRYFSVRNQLPYFIVVSYDDYLSGHQFQTGIDNGASVAVSLKGSTLSWATTFSDEYGSAKTLHHYRLFDSPDGVSVTVLKDNIPPSLKGSLNISALPAQPGAHKLYLKLVAKAGIFNKISDAGGSDGGLPAFTLTVSKSEAKGGIISAVDHSISCATNCSSQTALYGANASVTLSARPSPGYHFTGWSGACTGIKAICPVTLTAAGSVTANFAKKGKMAR